MRRYSLARGMTVGSVAALVVWCGVWLAGYVRPMVVRVASGAGGDRFMVIGKGAVMGVVQRASGAAGPGVVMDTTTLGTLVVREEETNGQTVTRSEASVVVNPTPAGPTNGRLGFGRVTMRPRIAMQVGPTSGAMVITMSVDGWAVPCWVVAVVPLISGMYFGWRVREVRRRRLEGRCASCGYDLRASRDRCPECGAVVDGAGVPG